MLWHQGTVGDAIAEAKRKDVLFVVFITRAGDEMSADMTKAVDDVTVSAVLNPTMCVPIILDADSETCRQFSQIYPVVAVPCLFVIGRDGVLLEMIPCCTSADQLVTRLHSVFQKHNISAVVQQESASTSGLLNPPLPSQPIRPDSPSSSPEPDSCKPVPENSAQQSTSKEDAKERAERLVREIREKKRREEEELRKQQEVERRDQGKSVGKLRQWQQEQDVMERKREMDKDKIMEKEARERVRQQIAQDKADRAARMNAMSPSTTAPPDQPTVSNAQSGPAYTGNDCRLQFRLPDGSTHFHIFNADDTLADIITYIHQVINHGLSDFNLSTVFPRYLFTDADKELTLRELNLLPSSNMLILPRSSGQNSIRSVSPLSFANIWVMIQWLIISPITKAFGTVRAFLLGQGAVQAQPASASAGPSRDSRPSGSGWQASSGTVGGTGHATEEGSADYDSFGGARKRTTKSNKTQKSAVKREGNIHRLHDSAGDSDDENNTWNGNSTQQM